MRKGWALRRLQEWAATVERPAWRPVVTETADSPLVTRFGGAAWVHPGESVPTCQRCGRELQLFVQLDLSALPEEFAVPSRRGVVQLFYCRSARRADGLGDCGSYGAWEPFSTDSKLVRLVPRQGLGPVPNPSGEPSWPAQAITGWERFDDRPHPQDHATAGLRTTYDFEAGTVHVEAPAVGVAETFDIDALPVEDIAIPADKDKLGGWPWWVQGPEYPSCPICGDTMEVIFQLDSQDHIPFMFGDAGMGHISMCRAHPDVVAFGWACT